MSRPTSLSAWLARHRGGAAFTLFAMLTAFAAYSCMYAFRKPFTAAVYDGVDFLGIGIKTWYVIAQVIGYTISKFLGIRVVAAMRGERRAATILGLVGAALAALFCFAVVPPPWNILFMFANGIPLGMIWGLVFSYLEGRRNTELLGAGLCASFIFSSGLVKSAGKFTMVTLGVSEFWMPFVTGALFTLPLVLFVLLLDRLPPPDAADESLRTRRAPMDAAERRSFFASYAAGIVILVFVYVMLTMYRDMRDNFAADIWNSLGYGKTPGIFTATEIPITIAVLVMMGLLVLIRDNFRAFAVNHAIIFTGFALLGWAGIAFRQGWLDAPLWMVLSGFGLYMGYVPFNAMLFERQVAAFRRVANVGFLIYLADSFGYLGSVAAMLWKNFGHPLASWLEFFLASGDVIALCGMAGIVVSYVYFRRRYRREAAGEQGR